MNKYNEFKRLLSDYTDQLGRVTYLPAIRTNPLAYNYDSLNQNLWTGEANILMTLSEETHIAEIRDGMLAKTRKGLDAVKIVPGLYSRQPEPYRTLPTDADAAQNLGFSHPYDIVSLDEYNGIAFSATVLPELLYIAEDIVDYGKKQEWCFHDRYPRVNPYNVIIKDPKGFFRNVRNILKSAFQSKDFTGSNEMDKIIDNNLATELFSHILQPKDRLILKLASKGYDKPNWIDWLNFLLATIITTKESDNETSGKILAFFRLKMIELQDKENLITYFLKKIFHKRLTRKYGNNYMKSIFMLYYEDSNHPFHNLIDGVDIYTKPKARS